MRVGIVAPMWSEARCLAPGVSRRARRIEIGEDVSLCISGVGRDRASAAARELVSEVAPNDVVMLACIGVAGGLHSRLAAGDLVIADRVLAADGRELPTDASWRDALAARLRSGLSIEPRVSIGAIAESTGVLASAADKRARFAATSALAVDMESAAVAAVAAARGAPCLVLRAVCDPAHLCIPRCALEGTDADGNLRALAFSLALLAHPFEIGAVIGLQRAFGRAQRALTAAIRIAGPSLCASDAKARGR